jgi:hypothetical protein
MKKIFIVLILTLLLSGCGLYNLGGFVLPDDMEFMAVVESLDTPEKICSYMMNNFTYKAHIFFEINPYTLWKTKKGDCNDFSTFAVFAANYHGYETYQIKIIFKDTLISHYLGVFVENSKYTSSSNRAYYKWRCESFKDIVIVHVNKWKSYKVFDYKNNLIEEGINGR